MSDNYRVVNMTNFFNRELFMYALGDIKFKKPVSLKKIAYIMFFLLIWTVPLTIMFGIQTSPLMALIFYALPIFLGVQASNPVFGGKGLKDWAAASWNFQMKEPAVWTDFQNNKVEDDIYYVENEIWISRRRELNKLKRMMKENA